MEGGGRNYPGGNCLEGAIFLGENCPRSIILGVINYPGGNYPGGNCPRTVKFPFFLLLF